MLKWRTKIQNFNKWTSLRKALAIHLQHAAAKLKKRDANDASIEMDNFFLLILACTCQRNNCF